MIACSLVYLVEQSLASDYLAVQGTDVAVVLDDKLKQRKREKESTRREEGRNKQVELAG